MTGWTHTVSDPDDFARMLARLGDTPMPYTVTVKLGSETKRDRLNRFIYEAYKQVSQKKGDHTPGQVRAITKLRVGVPMMREISRNFREIYDASVKPLNYQIKLQMMVEAPDWIVHKDEEDKLNLYLPITSVMSLDQMKEYKTRMLRYWDAEGFPVMLPDYDL